MLNHRHKLFSQFKIQNALWKTKLGPVFWKPRKLGEVCPPETSCMKGTSLHMKNMWIKQLCNRKVRDFAMVSRALKVSGVFEKRAPGLSTSFPWFPLISRCMARMVTGNKFSWCYQELSTILKYVPNTKTAGVCPEAKWKLFLRSDGRQIGKCPTNIRKSSQTRTKVFYSQQKWIRLRIPICFSSKKHSELLTILSPNKINKRQSSKSLSN